MESSESVPVGLVACEYCDLLHRERPLRPNETARCLRCGGFLYRDHPQAIEHALSLAIAALALWVIANAFPFLRVSLEGQVQTNTIAAGVVDLWSGGARLLAGLILLTTIVAPLLQLLGMLYVLLPLRLGWRPPGVAAAARFQESMGPWAMLDVYMLALLVTLVKLAQMARVDLLVGAWAFGAFFLVLIAAGAAYDGRAVWSRVEALE
jgi:paraquat-inducible protein A